MIDRLLAGAESVIARAQHCWLMTFSRGGSIDARPMGRVVPSPGQTDWRLRFLVDLRSKKVLDIQSASDVRLIFDRDDDAFVSLSGPAEVIADAGSIEQLWQPAYERFFPTAAEKANAAFIDVRAEEMRLWIRGLTPEPFGLRSLTLWRPVDGDWRVE